MAMSEMKLTSRLESGRRSRARESFSLLGTVVLWVPAGGGPKCKHCLKREKLFLTQAESCAPILRRKLVFVAGTFLVFGSTLRSFGRPRHYSKKLQGMLGYCVDSSQHLPKRLRSRTGNCLQLYRALYGTCG